MKLTQHSLNPSRALSSFFSATLVASILCSPAALAKKGGNGGGGNGGGDDGGGGSAVPQVVTSPVTYTETELRWEDDGEFNDPDFQGIYVNFVNRVGLASGFVMLPAPEGVYGERRAVVNVDPATGGTADTMVDLNSVFATELAALNSDRTDGPWRLAYGRGINDAGMIGCQLVPATEPTSLNSSQAAAEGVAPVPVLQVVVDLNGAGVNRLVVLDPLNTSPDQSIMQVNENGDVITADGVDGVYNFDIFRREIDGAGAASYAKIALPAISGGLPSFNSSREVSYVEDDTGAGTSTLVHYLADTGDSSVLWEVNDGTLGMRGIAEDGSAYALHSYSVTSGRGKNKTTTNYSIPHHVISSTERVQLTEQNAELPNGFRNVSRAAISGEEEVLIRISSGEYQLYKPNFGARFVLPIDPWNVSAGFIAPPFDTSATTTSAEDYNAGYIAYSSNPLLTGIYRSYILTPQPGQ